MTIDHPVRRFLARVCSDDTMARIVDPTLADMRVERGRPAWLGYLALARALTIHTIGSIPGGLARVYADDERAVPRAALTIMASAFVVAIPFLLISTLGTLRTGIGADPSWGIIPHSARSAAMFLRLLPEALVVTLPPALLVALPLALRNRQLTAQLLRRLMALAVAACLAMGVLVNWGTPLAHPDVRVIVDGNPGVQDSGRETAFTAFRHQLESLRRNTTANPESVTRVRRGLEYRYQWRLALIVSPVPLALLALALAATRAGLRRPLAIGALGSAGYILALYRLDVEASRFVSFVPVIAAGLVAWIPNACMISIAGALTAAGDRRRLTG